VDGGVGALLLAGYPLVEEKLAKLGVGRALAEG